MSEAKFKKPSTVVVSDFFCPGTILSVPASDGSPLVAVQISQFCQLELVVKPINIEKIPYYHVSK